jgi:hypothetical protein
MMADNDSRGSDQEQESQYEPPGIEAVMTPEELEREVLYSGNGSVIICPR